MAAATTAPWLQPKGRVPVALSCNHPHCAHPCYPSVPCGAPAAHLPGIGMILPVSLAMARSDSSQCLYHRVSSSHSSRQEGRAARFPSLQTLFPLV